MQFTISFDPIIAQLGPFQLGWHGVFTAAAVVIAVWLAARLGRDRHFAVDELYSIATWGVVGGIVGARLFHVMDHIPYYAQHPLLIPQVWEGGIAIYGAFVGGIIGGWIAARRYGLPAWPLLDLAAPCMLVGQAIGRLGCLSNGDAWGAPCGTGPGICLTYTNPNDLLPASLHGVPTHAYPVYEILCEVAILAVLWLFRGWLARRPGLTFLVASLGYAATRFGLTFFRQETIVFAGLQEAQVIAVVSGLLTLGLLAYRLVSRPRPTALASASV